MLGPRGSLLVVLVGLGVGLGGTAAAAPATSDSTAAAAAETGGWLDRTLRRYFGNDAPGGQRLEGRSVELVDRYAAHAGKLIEVVIVQQVARFDESWEQKLGTSRSVLRTVVRPFQSYTRDSTIRQNLLFRRGQLLDPFLVADSERLLRGLEFIEDVRILVVPLDDDGEAVAIVVETRDRWPFGAVGVVKDVGWYEFGLYSSNVAGVGLRLDNRLLVRQERDPDVGYHGQLRKGNLGGSFIDGNLTYEDTYRRLNREVGLSRELSHPSIRVVGGAGWRRVRERDAGPDPDDREAFDSWLGRVIRLRVRSAHPSTARPVLVPALRYTQTTYLDRPVVSRDSLRNFHNATSYLVGLTYQRLKYYKTSFLTEMGETENLPAGLTVKLTGGYQDGEYNDRSTFNVQNGLVAVRNRGDVLVAGVDFGGFYRNRIFEDGSLVVRAAYATPLLVRGDWRQRFLVRTTYHRAINRVTERALELGDESRPRGLEGGRIFGNQRLVCSFEHRVFTPWSLLGFRMMLMGFADAGVIAGEDDPLLEQKFYGSVGLAFRLRNPDLVIPAVQLRVAFLNRIDDKGVQIGIKVGGPDTWEIPVPGARPGGITFR